MSHLSELRERAQNTWRELDKAITAGVVPIELATRAAFVLQRVTLRDQDAWHEIDDPEHPAPRDGSPFIGGVWLRADQRWHCTITAWMPWWNKDGCPFDIWSPVRLPPPPMSRREG